MGEIVLRFQDHPKEYATVHESSIDRFVVPVPQSRDVMTEILRVGAQKMLAHIDAKRKALGIDKARERVLMDMADRQKLEAV